MERPLSSTSPNKRNDASRNEQKKGRGREYCKKYREADPVGETVLHHGLQGEKVGREEYRGKQSGGSGGGEPA